MTKRAPHPLLVVASIFTLALLCSYGLDPARGWPWAIGGAVAPACVGWVAVAVTYRAHPWTAWALGALAALAVLGLGLIGHG